MSGESDDVLESVAHLVALGIDPLAISNIRDPFIINYLSDVGKRAHKIRETLDKNLAVYIAEAVGKLFKK